MFQLLMYGETVDRIMTINLIVKTRLNRVGVGGSGLRRIRAILLSLKPTTSLTVFLSPIPHNMVWNQSYLGSLHFHGVIVVG
jgi:hypothetical protein